MPGRPLPPAVHDALNAAAANGPYRFHLHGHLRAGRRRPARRAARHHPLRTTGVSPQAYRRTFR
ncbi:hypothetical protein [Streptomyces platensis]|uniref:hypothetical protein n=1 Tax=Streptomyces platensis TaxID=58346 RepID=UPI0037A5CF35